MIYRYEADKVIDDNAIYGFMDGSLDFNPANLTAGKELLNIISRDVKKPVFYFCEVRQSHGSGIIVLDKYFKKNFSGMESRSVFYSRNADGIFTCESGIALCIRTADCVPVLFISLSRSGSRKSVIGAVHCGWKGAYGGILKNAKNVLENKFNDSAGNVSVIIGPSICGRCYEVKEDFLNLFLTRDISSEKFFIKDKNKNKIFFDLKAFIKDELVLIGFNGKNIYDLNKCNFEDAKFFSYRRNKNDGRQVSFIALL